MKLTNILAIEENEELLSFQCQDTGIPAWVYLRAFFIRAIMSDFLYCEPLCKIDRQRKSILHISHVFSKTLKHNIFNQCSKLNEICIFSSGMGQIFYKNMVFDKNTEYFFECYSDKALYLCEHANLRNAISSFKYKPHYHFSFPIDTTIKCYARLRETAAIRRLAEDLIELCLALAKKTLNWEPSLMQIQLFHRSVINGLARGKLYYRHYYKLIKKFNIKIFLKEGGSFGQYAPLNLAAHDLGIVTAEMQHGVVSSGHDLYNVSTSLANCTNYRRTIPKYFLSYGKWWGNQISIPMEKVPIGYPHRNIQRIALIEKHSALDILILGDGIDTLKYHNLTTNIAKIISKSNLSVKFRPHPLEKHRLNDHDFSNIEVDLNENIYDSFKTSFLVISEVSTGLFEAIGIARHILVWYTAKSQFCFPQLDLPYFHEIAELDTLLPELSNNTTMSYAKEQDYWAINPIENFQRFVNEHL